MNNFRFAFVSLSLLSLLAAATSPATPEAPQGSESPTQKGTRIATEVDRANQGFVGEYAEMEMILINAHGDRTHRKLVTLVREKDADGDQSISIFKWPADVKGTKMLTWSHKTEDDDQWLFMPAIKRVKRISSRNKTGAFMGSEFAYEDLGSQEVEKFTHTFIEETEYEGRACWVNERVPVSEGSGYSKQKSWIDKEYMNPLRIEYYDRKGDLLKVAHFRDYRKLDQWWRVFEIDIENVQTGKKSLLTWQSRELGKAYGEQEFTSDSLGNE